MPSLINQKAIRNLLAKANHSRKRGGIGIQDADDFETAVWFMSRNDYEGLAETLNHLDTQPRDVILHHVHPSLWRRLKCMPLHEAESIEEFKERFGRKRYLH